MAQRDDRQGLGESGVRLRGFNGNNRHIPAERLGNPAQVIGISNSRERRQGILEAAEPSFQRQFRSDPGWIALSHQEGAIGELGH